MSSLCDLLELLEPTTLRTRILAPFESAREHYVPDLDSCVSWDAVQAEVTRYVQYVWKRVYASASEEAWPLWLAERDSEQLLRRHVGWRRDVMRIVDKRGVRGLLDVLTTALQRDRLRAYLEANVVLAIERLEPAERISLAAAYIDRFGVVPVERLDYPSVLALRWREVVYEHAELVLNTR